MREEHKLFVIDTGTGLATGLISTQCAWFTSSPVKTYAKVNGNLVDVKAPLLYNEMRIFMSDNPHIEELHFVRQSGNEAATVHRHDFGLDWPIEKKARKKKKERQPNYFERNVRWKRST